MASTDLLSKLVRTLAANESIDSITATEHLHPSLQPLFPSSRSVADLRHTAWGCVVFELIANHSTLEKKLTILSDYRDILSGVNPDSTPAKLGYYSLRFRKDKAEGRALKLLEALAQDEKTLSRSLILLAAMAEPGYALAAFRGGAALENPSQVGATLSFSKCGQNFGTNWLALDQIAVETHSSLTRALAFFSFVCTKTLYDRIVPPVPDLDIRETPLFIRTIRQWATAAGLQASKDSIGTPVTDAVPILLPGAEMTLWEQYSHVFIPVKSRSLIKACRDHRPRGPETQPELDVEPEVVPFNLKFPLRFGTT